MEGSGAAPDEWKHGRTVANQDSRSNAKVLQVDASACLIKVHSQCSETKWLSQILGEQLNREADGRPGSPCSREGRST